MQIATISEVLKIEPFTIGKLRNSLWSFNDTDPSSLQSTPDGYENLTKMPSKSFSRHRHRTGLLGAAVETTFEAIGQINNTNDLKTPIIFGL